MSSNVEWGFKFPTDARREQIEKQFLAGRHLRRRLHEVLADLHEGGRRLRGLLRLEDGLHVAVPLQEPLRVQGPLFEVLLAPRVDALEERLELGLLLVPELAVLARERAAAHVLAGLALLVLEFVGDLLDALGLGVVLLAREHVLPPPPLEMLRKQEEKRQQKAVRARQIAERQDVQIAHNMQYTDFNASWDKYLAEYDRM